MRNASKGKPEGRDDRPVDIEPSTGSVTAVARAMELWRPSRSARRS